MSKNLSRRDFLKGSAASAAALAATSLLGSSVAAEEEAGWDREYDVIIAGAQDGTIEGYYKVQQDAFIASGAVEAEVPVSDYVMFDIMIEAGK